MLGKHKHTITWQATLHRYICEKMEILPAHQAPTACVVYIRAILLHCVNNLKCNATAAVSRVCVISLRVSSRREENTSQSCHVCVLDEGNSSLSEAAPATGSAKGTQWQNSLVNKKDDWPGDHASPPLGELNEKPNTSPTLRLFPLKAETCTFILLFPLQPLSVSFIPHQKRLLILSQFVLTMRVFLPAEF